MTAFVESENTLPVAAGIFGIGRLNLHRGYVRLAIGVTVLWFVFWSCAYVIHPYTSLTPQPASFALLIMAWGILVPCVIAALVLAYWIAAGFRPNDASTSANRRSGSVPRRSGAIPGS
jgi:hypothetical protein